MTIQEVIRTLEKTHQKDYFGNYSEYFCRRQIIKILQDNWKTSHLEELQEMVTELGKEADRPGS